MNAVTRDGFKAGLDKSFQSQKVKVLDFIGGSDINSQIIIGDTLFISNVM
jgi:hypothetical protein